MKNDRGLWSVAVVLVVLATASTGAQHAERPALPPNAAAQIEDARVRLALTDEQRAQVEPILRSGMERRVAILKKHGLVDESGQRTDEKPRLREARKLRRELDDVQDEVIRRLEKVLSKEQLDEYKKIQRELRDAARDRIRP